MIARRRRATFNTPLQYAPALSGHNDRLEGIAECEDNKRDAYRNLDGSGRSCWY